MQIVIYLCTVTINRSNMIRNLIGPPVTGTDFIGREKELTDAWKAIEDTNSLSLTDYSGILV